MPNATTSTGALQILENCYIQTYWGKIQLRVLPQITDGKRAQYQNEPIMGRSSPLVIYSHSEPRNISMDLTFLVTEKADIRRNLQYYYLIQSLVYPGDPTDAPYSPPPIANLVCGNLFGSLTDGSPGGLCCILENYSFRAADDVAWDAETMLPYKFTISTSWQVVYSCKNLPCNNRIIALGR